MQLDGETTCVWAWCPTALLRNCPQVTGITDQLLQSEGVPLSEALSSFIDFVSSQCASSSSHAPTSISNSPTTVWHQESHAEAEDGKIAPPLHAGPGSTTPLLVAHNGKSFDFRFLATHLRKAGLAAPAGWLGLDSLQLAKDCVPKLTSYKLGAAALLRCATPAAHASKRQSLS